MDEKILEDVERIEDIAQEAVECMEGMELSAHLTSSLLQFIRQKTGEDYNPPKEPEPQDDDFEDETFDDEGWNDV